jgi:hypothetical protein
MTDVISGCNAETDVRDKLTMAPPSFSCKENFNAKKPAPRFLCFRANLACRPISTPVWRLIFSLSSGSTALLATRSRPVAHWRLQRNWPLCSEVLQPMPFAQPGAWAVAASMPASKSPPFTLADDPRL